MAEAKKTSQPTAAKTGGTVATSASQQTTSQQAKPNPKTSAECRSIQMSMGEIKKEQGDGKSK